MRRIFTLSVIFLLLLTTSTYSQPFKIVKDIATDIYGIGPSPWYATVNGNTYFSIVDNQPSAYNKERGLWKTDGTAAGTVKLKSLWSVKDLVNVNGTLFFSARDENGEDRRIWKSDGTAAGTVMVRSDISLGWWETPSTAGFFTNVNGTLYFVADDGVHGREVWKTDGTAAGTVMVKDLNVASPTQLTNVNGELYFNSNGLWKTNGTDAGTIRLSTTPVAYIVGFNGSVFFRGDVGGANDGLWKTDGTPAGTGRISPAIGPLGYLGSTGTMLVIKGDNQLFISDGTTAGTTRFFDGNLPDFGLYQVVIIGSTIYFTTEQDPGSHYSVWKSDGTEAGTVNMNLTSGDYGIAILAVLNGKLVFTQYDAVHGTEVWISDGTAAGTALVADICEGTANSFPSNFYVINGTAYFSANDGIHGQEIWKTDGTTAGTMLVKDCYSPTAGSDAKNFLNFNNNALVFTATDNIPKTTQPPNGHELYISDGTIGGTYMLKDIGVLGINSSIGNLTSFNNKVLFSANDGGHGIELWITDGTSAGTTTLKEINSAPGAVDRSSNPAWLTVGNNTVFMGASNSATINGRELWKTDGTEAGTVMVKDIYPGTSDSDPTGLVYTNGTLFFAANDGINGRELWKSDGTDAGTTLVKNIHSLSGSNPSNLVGNGSIIYFVADDGANGAELWKSDGTDAGTLMVKDINTSGNSDPASLIVLNGVLYFTATNGSGGRELWKSDGTNGGTVLVKDINAVGGSDPVSLTILNGLLYFSADNGTAGRELWRTDGSSAGTTMVMDINTGGSSNPTALTRIGFKLFFGANDGTHGNEIWATDGITTALVQDIEPGIGSSDPTQFAEVNGKIFTSVINSTWGREVWVGNAPTLNSPLPLTLLEFKGSVVNDNGILQWKTDNELNTKSFAVERSTNGRNFSSVGHVNAANASGVHNYDYTDANLKSLGSSIIYYRLRQVDSDNKFTYSRIVALTLDKQKSFVMLYPNPVRKDINLTITLANKEKLNWQLTDNNGKVVKNGYYELGAGSTAVVIDGGNLAAGNYLLSLNGEQLQQTIKIVKQ